MVKKLENGDAVVKTLQDRATIIWDLRLNCQHSGSKSHIEVERLFMVTGSHYTLQK